MKLVKTLKNGYTIDMEEFIDEDDYCSDFITTNIATLKELESQIKVESVENTENPNFTKAIQEIQRKEQSTVDNSEREVVVK